MLIWSAAIAIALMPFYKQLSCRVKPSVYVISITVRILLIILLVLSVMASIAATTFLFMVLILKNFFRLCRKPDFVHLFVDVKNTKVTPSLPQRGRQPKGCIPLTPFCNLVNLMRGNRNVGGCPSGGGGGDTKSPKERYDSIFLSISTEHKKDSPNLQFLKHMVR